MHDFIDTMISKQRLCNILFYTGFHETIIATEISTRGVGGGAEYHHKPITFINKCTQQGYELLRHRNMYEFLKCMYSL